MRLASPALASCGGFAQGGRRREAQYRAERRDQVGSGRGARATGAPADVNVRANEQRAVVGHFACGREIAIRIVISLAEADPVNRDLDPEGDRKSTRLNSSH